MSNERVDSSSLLELIDEQEELIDQRSRDLGIARRSLERARTQWLVLQNYDTVASTREREEAAMHLEGIAAYVQQLEDGIIASRALIKAYKKARVDNFPWVRALGFAQRQVVRRLPSRRGGDALIQKNPDEPRALEE
jgi:hypothetical protein